MRQHREISILTVLPMKRFHSCVLTTYSFDFNYFNHDAMARLRKAGVRNINIFVDDSMLQQYLGSLSGYAHGAAKHYSITGVVRPGAFHPKLTLLFGRDGHGFLIIGSGNLTASGHGKNQELWGAFHIDGPDDPKAPLFKQAWEYIKTLGAEAHGVSQRKLEWIEANTPWLQDIDSGLPASGFDIGNGVKAFFLTNSGNGILNKLRDIVTNEVSECTLISPFFDNKAAVLYELERMYPEAKINVIVQPDTCQGGLAGKTFERVRFYDWQTVMPEGQERYLHAKFLHIQTAFDEYCLFGSANITAPALGTSFIQPSNEEASLLIKRGEGSWLKEIGLDSKGTAISVETIATTSEDTEDESKAERSFRLNAIDRMGLHFQVYMDCAKSLENVRLAFYNGWGEEQGQLELGKAEFKKEYGYYHVVADKISDEVLYGQLCSSGETAISNKQIVHDMISLSRTNPDPSTQKIEEVLDRIEFADAEMAEILTCLDLDDLVTEKSTGAGGSSKKDNSEQTETDGSGDVLSYDEFVEISNDYHHKKEVALFYGTHRIERILETLRVIFGKLKIQDIDIAGQDEEADRDSLDSSEGRIDENYPEKKLPTQTPSAFAHLQKTVFGFFNQYIKILEKQRKIEHKVNILDASMFVIALHLLLDFLNKTVSVKNRNEQDVHEEILLQSEGDYFAKDDYCRIVTEVIGKFSMLLINGIDEAADEYVMLRINKCRKMAYWHAICCLARLSPQKGKEGDESTAELISKWNWELAMNLRKYYAPVGVNNETVAREEIRHRLQMMHGKNETDLGSLIVRKWQMIERSFAKANLPSVANEPYKKGARVFCEHTGFAHLVSVTPYEKKQNKVGVARAGYPPSKSDTADFEGKEYIAEMAQIIVFKESC